MKNYKILLLAVLLLQLKNVQAQDNYSLSSYTVTITGTSNLHDWKETVEKVSGKGEAIYAPAKNFTLQSFNIIMEVKSIKSGEGSIMNNKTYNALKSDKFPQITFLLAEPISSIPVDANAYAVTAKGSLTIAGVTKTINIPVKISTDGNKAIIVDGSQQVKMTDFGVDPPIALFGALKTGDAITISFKANFSPLNL